MINWMIFVYVVPRDVVGEGDWVDARVCQNYTFCPAFTLLKVKNGSVHLTVDSDSAVHSEVSKRRLSGHRMPKQSVYTAQKTHIGKRRSACFWLLFSLKVNQVCLLTTNWL